MSNNSCTTSRDLETLRQLISSLRDKNEILEDELGKLKTEQVFWDVERRRLERELVVQDEKLNDLATKLGVREEAEAKAVRRYDRAFEYCRELKEKIEESKRGMEAEVELSGLKDELVEKEVELRESRERARVLEGELGDLRVSFHELGKGMEKIKTVIGERDEEIVELRRRNEELEGEKGESWRVVNEVLHKIEVCRADILEIGSNKDGKIEGLMKEKREALQRCKMMEERVSNLEAHVATYLYSEAKQGILFGTSRVQMILSLIVNAVDGLQEEGLTLNLKEEVEACCSRNFDAEPAFGSHVNDMKHSLSKCEETVKMTVRLEEEVIRENGAACDQKSQSPYIQISDSEDDKISCEFRRLKRARASSLCSIQKHGDDSSSDGSLNPKRKIKKLEYVIREVDKQGPSIADSDCRSDNKSSTLHKQTLSAIRKCTPSTNVKAPGLECCDLKEVYRSNKHNVLEYMAKNQRKLEKNVVASVADMVLACREDAEFCTRAVCALFRNGLLSSGQNGLAKHDIDRGIAMTEFLVDGDLYSGKKKSVDELKQCYPGGLEICKQLAFVYSDKLFELFKSNGDPLFSHLSTDKQYS